jgi:cytochrome c biogenesis protein CcmG/thiol:disulfide interchange protein DsbE
MTGDPAPPVAPVPPAPPAPAGGRLGHVWPFTAFVVLVGLLYVGLGRDPRLLPSPFIGRPAPPLDLPTLADPARRLSSTELRGEPTVVNVWASWCVACRQEHATLMALAASRRVRLVGLNYKDAPDDARAWLERHGDPYQAVAVDADGRAGIDWGVYGVPETFFLDAAGVVRHRHVGPLAAASLEPALQLIGVPPLAPAVGASPETDASAEADATPATAGTPEAAP